MESPLEVHAMPSQGTPAAAQGGRATPLVISPQATPQEIYNALRAARRELGSQLNTLEDKRQDLSRLLTTTVNEVDRKGLEARLSEVDKQISAVDKQIATTATDVATAAAVPGAVVPDPPRPPQPHPNDADYAMMFTFGLVFLIPTTIAYTRRIWRQSAAKASNWPRGLNDRMDQLEQTMEAVAIEVERVGEGQRYMTTLFADNGSRALGAGSMDPLRVSERERERVGESARRSGQ